MKIHRFFLKEKTFRENDGQITVTDSDVIHQIKNVLRLQIGQKIIFLDNGGKVFEVAIEALQKTEGLFLVEQTKTLPEEKQKINLFFAIPKKDKAEWVLQKGTELGAANFCPIISDRTEKINLKKERAELIIKEAAEQSAKVFLPKFHEATGLEKVLEKMKSADDFYYAENSCFYLDLDGPKINLNEIRQKTNINIFVGPEGGWSEKDKNIFADFNIQSFSLGDFVLRAETASIAVVAALKIF